MKRRPTMADETDLGGADASEDGRSVMTTAPDALGLTCRLVSCVRQSLLLKSKDVSPKNTFSNQNYVDLQFAFKNKNIHEY